MKDGADAYFDFSKEEKDHAIRFLLESLLRSRGTCGLGSNEPDYDEDVNIYLAHLLFAVSTASYQRLASKYVIVYPTDLINLVEGAADNYIKYFVYKINADHLLVDLGVFRDRASKGGEARGREERTRESSVETARGYYEQAALYNQRIYRKKTAIGDVLEKLARHFDRYCSILQVTRKDFFNFVSQFKETGGGELVLRVQDSERQALLREKQDAFLDLYLEWMKAKNNKGLVQKINQLCDEIRQLDPQFRFSIV